MAPHKCSSIIFVLKAPHGRSFKGHAFYLGVLDQIMDGLHFEHEAQGSEIPRVGEHPRKKATHFIDHHEKLLSADTVKKGKVSLSPHVCSNASKFCLV